MNDYLVQEEYKEYLVGVRVIRVQAESKQDVLDGDYDMIDVIEEITASGDVEETRERRREENVFSAVAPR